MGEGNDELMKAEEAIYANSFDIKIGFENNKEEPKQNFVLNEFKILKKLKENLLNQIGSSQNFDSGFEDLKKTPEQ